MSTPGESDWQPGQRRRRRMSPAVTESLLVLAFVGLLTLGACALMAYVVVNHEPRAQAAATSPEKPSGGGAGPTTTATTSAAPTTTAPTTTSAAAGGAADLAAGKQVFTTNCAACHTLKDAGTNGTVGPNLDELKPDVATVSKQVTNGGAQMPAFKGQLTPKQIEAVSQYVAAVAGKG